MIISVDNKELIRDAPTTRLVASVSADETSLDVKNASGAVAGKYAIIGELGEENTEIKLISEVAGTTITVSALSLDHAVDMVVYFVDYNQIRIYKKPAEGVYGETPFATVDVAPDNITTSTEIASSSTDTFKTCFYNFTTLVESGFSPEITPAGFPFYAVRTLTDRVLSEFGDPDCRKVTRAQVADWFTEAQEQLQGVAIKADESYGLKQADIEMEAGKELYGTSDGLPANFRVAKKVWVSSNGSDFFPATFADIQDIRPDVAYSVTTPLYYFEDDQIGIKPVGTAGGVIRLWCYEYADRLEDDSDELLLVMRGYTGAFVNYGKAMAFYADKKWGEGDRFRSLFEADKARFADEIAQRQKGQTRFVKSVAGDEVYLFGNEE